MDEPAVVVADRSLAGLRAMACVMLALSVIVVIIAVALPTDTLAWLRSEYWFFGRPLNWLEMSSPRIDLTHVILFAWVTLLLACLWPRAPLWRIGLPILALAVGSESLQFSVPGRSPLVSDLYDDLLGVAFGLALAAPLFALRSIPREATGRACMQAARWLALAGVLALPFVRWQATSLFGYPVQVADVFLAGAVLAFALGLASGVRIRLTAFHGWLSLYVVAMALACLVSPQPWASAGKWVGVVYLAALAVLVHSLADVEFARRLVLSWLGASWIVAILGCIAVVGFYLSAPAREMVAPLLSRYGSLPPGNYPRVIATFANPNMLCNYLNVSLVFALAGARLGWIKPVAALMLVMMLLVTALATISPGLGGIALSLGLWVWMSQREARPTLAGVALIAGVGTAALVWLGLVLVNPARPFEELSVRLRIWQSALDTVLRHPLRGVGLGEPVADVYFMAPSGEAQWLSDAHNTWLSIAGQAGVPAALALLGLSAYLLRNAKSASKAAEPFATLAAACALGFVSAFLYQGLGGSFEDARHLWLLIGLLAWLAQVTATPSGLPAAEPAQDAASAMRMPRLSSAAGLMRGVL